MSPTFAISNFVSGSFEFEIKVVDCNVFQFPKSLKGSNLQLFSLSTSLLRGKNAINFSEVLCNSRVEGMSLELMLS